MVEARAGERARTYLRAQIRCNRISTTTDCVVRNMSALGAQLECDISAGVPDEFTLHIPARGLERRAKVMWREKRSLGIRFEESQPDNREPARSRESLMAENARLKTQIRELARRLEDLGQDVSLDGRF